MTWPLLLTPFLPLLALVPGGKWALPLLAPLTLWFSFRERVKEGDSYRAWILGMVWAFLLSLGVIVLVLAHALLTWAACALRIDLAMVQVEPEAHAIDREIRIRV